MTQISVSAFLKKARDVGHLSQAAVARRVGCDRSTISRIEDGTRNATADMETRIAQAIGELIAESRAAA